MSFHNGNDIINRLFNSQTERMRNIQAHILREYGAKIQLAGEKKS